MNREYDNIPLPDALEYTVSAACARGRRTERRQGWTRTMGSVAAACAVFVLAVNFAPVAAALQDVPILGALVRVLQFGDGGQRTDGVQAAGGMAGQNTLRLTFQMQGEQTNAVPAYTVTRGQAPYRLTFTFSGVRGFDMQALERDALALAPVRDFYRNIILDDSAVSFTIELNEDAAYTVSEYEQPGYMELYLHAAQQTQDTSPVYFVRSASMPQGEQLALLAETYHAQGAGVVRTQDAEQFTLTLGAFDTKAEAEALLTELGQPEGLRVDSCGSTENPAP